MLHAAVALFGARSVEVKIPDQAQVTLEQKPGSFYMGNLAALEHNVHHHVECKHTFDAAAETAKVDQKEFASAASAKSDAEIASSAATAKGDQRLQIAVMIRCDALSPLEGTQEKLHSWPLRVLPRREQGRGPALGRRTRGAP